MRSTRIPIGGIVGFRAVLLMNTGAWLALTGYTSPEWHNAHTIEAVDEQTVVRAVNSAESVPPRSAPEKFVYIDSKSLSPEAQQAIKQSIDRAPYPYVVPPAVLDPDEFVYPGSGGAYVYYVQYDERRYQLETEFVIGDRCSTPSACLNRGIDARQE